MHMTTQEFKDKWIEDYLRGYEIGYAEGIIEVRLMGLYGKQSKEREEMAKQMAECIVKYSCYSPGRIIEVLTGKKLDLKTVAIPQDELTE